ncbi:WSC domain-containing protein [Xylariaceae sp. FL1651]|nr:WSC domain-containing protein [Xylariaceae sp. FL1651]
MVVIRSLAAIAALSLVNTAQAWYNEIPPCLSPFEPFVYTGCYDNGQPGQKEALSLRTDLDQQNMTVETCVAECKGNGYRLAGLSYYGVCYCGQTVSTALLPEDQCSFPCTGNSSETCGGNTEVNIWMDPTFPPLDGQENISEYVPVGCWTDDSSQGKALFYRQDNLNASTMTTETCLQSCLTGGFPFAGTEYGGECYCGVVVGNDTALATDPTTCNIACNGNASQICGGPARLSLYVAKDLQSLEPCGTPPNVSSTSSVTTPPVTSSTTISSSTSTSSSTSSTTVSSSTSTSSSTSSTTVSSSTSTSSSTSSTTVSSSTSTSSSTSSTPVTSSTTTSSSTYSTPKTSSTSKYPVTSTTRVTSSTTTSSSPVCTTTIVTPPSCEYHCGKWCSNPIPDWNDYGGCLLGWSQCTIQVTSCFLSAGLPGALDCFGFADWCLSINEYCGSNCMSGKCGKSDCFKGSPPKGGNPPTTTTSTYPCPTSIKTTTSSTKTPSPTSSCPVPTPTGVCTQPTNNKYGYSPGHPVGGIDLPIVTCNNIKDDWTNGYVFKLYTDKDSQKCPSYTRPQCGSACADACKSQYQQCEQVYAEGCKSGKIPGNYNDADAACKAQYNDCLTVNKNVKDNGHCSTWNGGW